MRGVGRFVEKHQNFARIPGNRIRFIGKYQQAQGQLRDELGREPTWKEIARKSKIPQKHARKLETELSPVHISGMNVDPLGAPLGDTGGYTFSADMERLELIYPDLTSQEQLVVDYTLGRNGKMKVSSNRQLAMKLGVTDARVSNIRASIAKKMQNLSWIR
jgi:DNA-directed RNA polymerase sigma subunit (sigma70/sigma32)